jgi:hypothetical protein
MARRSKEKLFLSIMLAMLFSIQVFQIDGLETWRMVFLALIFAVSAGVFVTADPMS